MDIEIKRSVLHELCSFVLEELSGGAGVLVVGLAR